MLVFMKKTILLSLLIFSIFTTPTKAQLIYTSSGNGIAGYIGDGGSPRGAELRSPAGITADDSGSIYIADQGNNVIRKVTTTGIISTYAGTGVAAYSGDSGLATAAALNSPTGVTIDGRGNLYIADKGNNCIRKITTAGIILTVAGNGSPGYSGNGGPAIAAQLNAPSGVAIDGVGNLYIADYANNVVRKVDTSGIISLYAGTGTPGYTGDGFAATLAMLNSPVGIAVDAAGDLFIADNGNHVVRKVNLSGIISTVAGTGTLGNSGDGGLATAALLNAPYGIALDASGNIYISDQGNQRIRRINTIGVISNYAGKGIMGYSGDDSSSYFAEFNSPEGIVFDGTGSLFVADNGNNVIRIITTEVAPFFTGGPYQSIVICENSVKNIDTLLTFFDPDDGETDTWSFIATPIHGIISGFPSTTMSDGGTETPTGILYIPTSGYYGTDNFAIRISDGISISITNINVTVNQTPSVTQPANQIVCNGALTAPVIFTGTMSTAVYNWTNNNTTIGLMASGTGSIPAFTAINSTNVPVMATVNVTPSGNGCAGPTMSFIITVNPIPSSTGATNSGPICIGGSDTLYDNSSNASTWSWTGSDGFSSTLQSPVVTPTVTTTYSLTLSSPGSGCNPSTVYTTAVTVSSHPTLASVNNNGPICAGTTLNLSVSGASNVTGYLWSGPVAITNSTSAAASIPSATTVASGVYTVTVNNGAGLGCTATYTTSATISPAPTLTSAGNNGPVCAGTTLSLTAVGASNVTGYLWSGPGSITNSTSAIASVPSATAGATGIYMVTVNNGTGLGCTASYITSATVDPVPTLSSAVNNGTICAGATLILSTVGASNVTGYLWSGPAAITNSTSAIATVPSATTGASGIYTVTVNNGAGLGCTSTYTTSATISPAPTLTSAGNNSPICAGATLSLSAVGAANVASYLWSGPVAITSATSAMASVPFATTGANGIYTVTVNNGTGLGCAATYTTSATVNPDPTLSSVTNNGPICTDTTLSLSAVGESNVTGYLWSGPVAITNATSAIASVPSATTGASGIYTITLNNGTGLGCTATYTTSATVNPDPTLSSVTNNGPICAGTTLSLSAVGASNVTSYLWSGPVVITNSTLAIASVPSATIGASGIYTVTVNNGTGLGCTATYTTSVTVNPDPTLSSVTNNGPVCAGATLSLSAVGASNVTGYLWSGPAAITNSTSAIAGVPSATTGANGIYTVTVNNGTGLGCTATYTTSATVNPDPTSTGATNNGPICIGGSVTLYDNSQNATTWLWTGSDGSSSTHQSPVMTPTATTTYSLTISTTGNGCNPLIVYTTTAIVNPVPALSGVINNGPICAGTTLSLSAVGASNVTGYLWTGPVAITNSTSAVASVPSATTGAGGIYTVTVYNGTGLGCTASYTTSTAVNPDPTLSSVTNNGPICAGATLSLSAVGASNVTGYLWSGPVTITNSTSTIASVPSAAIGASGIYSVTVNNGLGLGCTATYTTSATVSPVPTLTSANNNGPICTGATLNLSVSGASNVIGYLWAGPIVITNATSAIASVPSSTIGAGGIYTVTVNNGPGLGCTATYTTSATVSPAPALTSANNNSPICAGATLSLSVSGASNVTGYLWVGPVAITNSTSAIASVPSAAVSTTGIYTVTVNNGAGLGCTATYITSATVSPVPVLSGTTNNGPVCAGATLSLSAVGASNVTGYLWSGPVTITNSTSAIAIVPSATTGASGIYTVTVNNGTGLACTATYTTSATVNPDPTLSTVTNNGPICAGATLSLSAVGASNVTGYLWSGPAAITSSASAIASVPSVTTGAGGIYTVTVNNGTGLGCTASYTTSATINPDPTLSSATNNGPICAGATLSLSAVGASNVTGYLWSGRVMITNSTSAIASVPSATIGTSGIYTVTINNGTGLGCTATYTTSATISPTPSLTSVNNNGPICAGTTLNLSVNGAANVTGYLWQGPVAIANSTSAAASIPSATTGANGIYTVTVYNGSGLGCAATYTTSATVSPAPTLASANNNSPICAGATLNLSVSGAANVSGYLWQGPVVIANSTSAAASIPSATTGANGIYTVTVNNGSGLGCTATYTTSATISPAPTLTSVINNGPICAGTTLNLSVNGAANVTGYLWQGPVAITNATSAAASIPSATTGANGIYMVTVYNGPGSGCTATYTTSATVSPAPTLTSANNNGPVCVGTTLNLSVSGASNITGYLWAGPVAITNATSASASIPSATTGASGVYTVTVNNGLGAGCTATYITSATVNASPSSTGATNSGAICKGGTVTLYDNSSNVTTWSWTGSDGFSSTLQSPVVTPTVTTTYSLTLSSPGSGCNPSTVYTTAVTVSPAPTLTSANNNGPICAGTTLGLSVSGASNVTGYLWAGLVAITNATSAAANIPFATTGANGIYTVTVNNGLGSGCTATYTTSATVNAVPSSTGTTNSGAVCNGGTVTLYGNSSNATAWSWTGSDGSLSNLQNPVMTPTVTTTYSLTLSSTGSGCNPSTVYTTIVTVNPAPTLTSADNNGPICAGTTLSLSVSGASNVTGYLWAGPVAITNSTSATATVSSATTVASGVYTVTVNNGSGTGCTATYTTSASVNALPSSAGATNSGAICNGGTVTLYGNSSNATAWSWTGSDGSLSNLQNPVMTPTVTTTYSLTLSSTGSGCNPSTVYTTIVTVNPAPTLTSVNNNGPICAGTTLALSVSGSSNVAGYLWNGPMAITNSTLATATVPSATIGASGIYTVTVNNGLGSGCTATYTTSVTVSPAPALTSTNNSGPICAGATLNLSVSGASNVTGYLWAGPVAITNATSAAASVPVATTGASGIYTVTVNNGAGLGCTATYTTSATINPVPTLTSANNNGPICAGTTLSLSVSGASNVTGYLWAGPVAIINATSAIASVLSPTTGSNGIYTVTVNNGIGSGCTATYTTSATVNPAPALTSANNNSPICAGTTLALSVSGASNVTGYLWAGPAAITNATSADASVPSATTGANGIYTVTVNNGTGLGCTATYTTSATISPAPSLTSANNNGPICAGSTLNLSVSGASNVTGYLWAGPVAITNATSAAASIPSATTGASGIYTVTVNNGLGSGCTSTYTTSATVSPAPTLTSANNNGPICAGSTLNLSVSGASNVTGYLWAGPVAITNATSAVASVLSAATGASGIYTVTVNNGLGSGCALTYTTSATVSPAPTLTSANNNGPICSGTTLALFVTGASNVTGYSWAGPVAIINSTSAVANIPFATSAANGIYTVTVNNGISPGCTATYTTSATVSPAPTLTSANNSGPICSGATLNLSVSGASNVAGYLWSGPAAITNSTSASASIPSAMAGASGIYTVTIHNGSGLGCTATYTTSVTVSPSPTLISANNNGPICSGATLNLSVSGASNVTGYLWSGPAAITNSASASASIPSAMTGANGIYTVVVHNGTGLGCTATYTTSATVSPAPSLTSANNSGPICAGSTLNLSVTGASNVIGYLWQGPVAITNSTSALASIPSATTGANGIYTVTVNNGSGPGCTAIYTTLAEVNPMPSSTGVTNSGAICNGGTVTLYDNSSSATVWSWTASDGSLSSLQNPVMTPTATTTYSLTLSSSGVGCTSSIIYITTVIVNAVPISTGVTNSGPICSGSIVSLNANSNGATTWSWSGPGGFSSSLENPTVTPSVTTTYSLTISSIGSGCSPSIIYATTVNVNQLPIINQPPNQLLCGGNLTNPIDFSSNIIGTVYNWTNNNTSIGLAASDTGNIAPFTAINTTTVNATATVTVTPSANGCIGTAQIFTIIVKPMPVLTSSLTPPTICDSSIFSYTPANTIAGATYYWSRPYIAGIALAAGTGTGNPDEQLVNTTTFNIPVTYIYTVTANSCSDVKNIVVVVRPTPILSSVITDSNCSKTEFSYIPSCITPGVTYTWSRDSVANVLPVSDSGSGSIIETLINNSSNPIEVVYVYTINDSGCFSSQKVDLTLNPGITAPVIATNCPSKICANTYFENFGAATPPPPGMQYTWSAENATIWRVGDDQQYSIINFLNPGIAVVTLTSSAIETNCSSKDTFLVNVEENSADMPAEVIYKNNQFIALQNNEQSYQWGYDDVVTLDSTIIPGAINQNYFNDNPQFQSRYYWVLITDNNCTQKAYYNSPTSEAVITNAAGYMKCYPNPANDKISVDVSTTIVGHVQVEVLSMLGQKLKIILAVNNQAIIDVADLAQGCYIINCYSEGVKIATSKFIKN